MARIELSLDDDPQLAAKFNALWMLLATDKQRSVTLLVPDEMVHMGANQVNSDELLLNDLAKRKVQEDD